MKENYYTSKHEQSNENIYLNEKKMINIDDYNSKSLLFAWIRRERFKSFLRERKSLFH